MGVDNMGVLLRGSAVAVERSAPVAIMRQSHPRRQVEDL